jgi:hypothetical protein
MKLPGNLSKDYIPSRDQANIYGVILHTDAHPHIKKVLRDEDYWRALDEVSGPLWAIFAIQVIQGKTVMPKPPKKDGLPVLIKVWMEPQENKELLAAFRLESTEDLPALVVFAENEKGDVLRTVIKLDDTTETAAYNKLRKFLEIVGSSLKLVSKENLSEGARAYHAVCYAIKGEKEWEIINKGWGVLKMIKEILPTSK